MKKVYVIFIILLFANSYCNADNEEFLNPLKNFRFILESNDVYYYEFGYPDLDMKIKDFLRYNNVKNFEYIVTGVEKTNVDRNIFKYKIYTNCQLEYKRRNGLINWTLNFESIFIVNKVSKNSKYYLVKTSFFDEIVQIKKIGYLFFIHLFISLPVIAHILMNKKKKRWAFLVISLSIFGIILYYIFEIKKNKFVIK